MRYFSLSLVFSGALCLAHAAFAAVSPEKTIVVTGSDFQPPTEKQGQAFVAATLKTVKEFGYDRADGFLFCGDYTTRLNNRPEESEVGIAALKEALLSSDLKFKESSFVLIQGNHDPVGTRGISLSGANDPANGKYGVFVINEDDFMWLQSRTPTNGNPDVSKHEARINATVNRLDAYLKDKQKQQFRPPIFVLSHLPLHYTMRSMKDGDGRYAKRIIDVLNKYGKNGLNLVFLYGHNHSHGWDNYLGGGSVFLAPPKKIHFADPANPKKVYAAPIHFIYMNAGFTGYCSTDDANDGADKALSLCVFEISENNLAIRRFSPAGIIPLKAPGVHNTFDNNRERKLKLYTPDPEKIETYVLKL